MLKRIFSDNSWSLADGNAVVLTVAESMDGGKAVVTLSGELRGDTAPALRDELVALATVGADIVLDLRGLTDISFEDYRHQLYRSFSGGQR